MSAQIIDFPVKNRVEKNSVQQTGQAMLDAFERHDTYAVALAIVTSACGCDECEYVRELMATDQDEAIKYLERKYYVQPSV